MSQVLWFGPPDGYHFLHIVVEHEVTKGQFEEAFADRVDVERRADGSVVSIGFTDDDRVLEMVWRPDHDDPEFVFPITAYFPDLEEAGEP